MEKKIEIISDESCIECNRALKEILPLASKSGVTVEVIPAIDENIIPLTCLVDDDGSKQCFDGWGPPIKQKVADFLQGKKETESII